ncbi:inositol monophosphatase family protein [Aureimonas pseudogalii]|uniref:Fructose-1,6-bisphosphatase/inositol monophosphatase family enzyme n=1 Tax=Aureimonas pseudogalii TaxID=1744844 RepID=A0A7W6MKS5_9HYPH|nr:inositol monophosphatase family protein [Aureimonas pseudogalii]MBB3999177.1 fructose-1,6-bisphosphatase/inositol monophosphatase family enzyme [Aureimonas pseudogalii]
MTFDFTTLATILRDAAAAEILPRFRRLDAADVREKTSAVDLVTEADEAAERFIRDACAGAFPSALFVGEEGVAADAALLDRIGSSDLSIIVDPIDGTANYAAGAPLFGVMAAVVSKGETIGGIIYDPLGDDFMMAEKGSGAFLVRPGGERERLAVAQPVSVENMIGAASSSFLPRDKRRLLLNQLADIRIFANYRTAAHEYRLMASGFLHFQFYLKLMPWDHLAGTLLIQEAGGVVRRFDGSDYLPTHVDGGLITAPDEESWRAVRALVAPALD